MQVWLGDESKIEFKPFHINKIKHAGRFQYHKHRHIQKVKKVYISIAGKNQKNNDREEVYL